MATTYLDLSNEVLRELNEVVLTSGTFASATGIQGFVKDAINKSLFDVANAEPQLPFFSAGVSGSTDPFYGNVTVATVAGQRWYTLKASSSSITTDYAAVDWDDFYITTISVSGESAPYVSRGLKFISLIGVNAETIKERGDITDFSFPLSFHSVDIERESFPTGIAIFHFGHRPIPIASTAS